jgi:hypothetical protein
MLTVALAGLTLAVRVGVIAINELFVFTRRMGVDDPRHAVGVVVGSGG